MGCAPDVLTFLSSFKISITFFCTVESCFSRPALCMRGSNEAISCMERVGNKASHTTLDLFRLEGICGSANCSFGNNSEIISSSLLVLNLRADSKYSIISCASVLSLTMSSFLDFSKPKRMLWTINLVTKTNN